MKAVIMAGGKGTRLQSIVSDIPKPMVPVCGKPILEYQIENLKSCGVTDITLIVGHLGNVIEEYFGDGAKWDVHIDYVVEDHPLGTAGALFYLKDKMDDDFMLVFGDLMLDIDWNRFMAFHKDKGAIITLFGHPNTHPYDSDVIVVNEESKVLRIEPKNIDRDFYYKNFVNAGVYCVSPKLLENIPALEKIDLEKKIIAEQIPLRTVAAYHSTEYVKDMGTPDRYHAVEKDVINRVVSNRNLKNKQKCIFLDRDGTINKSKGFLSLAEDFELLDGVAAEIAGANRSKYLVVVATNQPVIARGECTIEELNRIHMKMETELGKQGAYIDGLYYCPHHPHKGYEGEVPELKIECDCRKPKIGMLIKAAEELNIDLSESWYVGDTTIDVQTGVNAGMKTILVKTGEAGQDGMFDVKPDFVADDLKSAIRTILEWKKK
ncbi:HAD-IIIA family hydrolase [Eisenbergiella tayi]|uniref:HAD-IIIA family hydrolase n=1 Tax=Eisenbergiella tayi TaxID=1432052 RepID=UPI000848DB86|nr:HAD-IIIA family hydrolase [Eisenbergiella tayi]ODR35239.1 D,D-heptose 1,7-bisphosphate phosphatase [Eisenbergiella tayi]